MAKKDKQYDTVKSLPAKAEPISRFAALFPDQFKSPAYVHVKYDRHKFGYETKKGELRNTANPGYKIVTFKGVHFVIPD
jgi:hypothetical protein